MKQSTPSRAEVTLTFTFQVDDVTLVPHLVKDMILVIPEEQLALGGLRADLKAIKLEEL